MKKFIALVFLCFLYAQNAYAFNFYSDIESCIKLSSKAKTDYASKLVIDACTTIYAPLYKNKNRHQVALDYISDPVNSCYMDSNSYNSHLIGTQCANEKTVIDIFKKPEKYFSNKKQALHAIYNGHESQTLIETSNNYDQNGWKNLVLQLKDLEIKDEKAKKIDKLKRITAKCLLKNTDFLEAETKSSAEALVILQLSKENSCLED